MKRKDDICFLSNQLEILAEALKKELFSCDRPPLGKKIVIIPDQAIKNYLQLFLARDEKTGISMGITFHTLSSFFSSLSFLEKPLYPDSYALALFLESEIKNGLEDKELFAPLIHYIGNNPLRLRELCFELSLTFIKYGTYSEENVRIWKRSWQQSLWERALSFWHPPCLKIKDFNFEGPLHLFGFHSIPELYSSFFERVSPLFVYCLNPCELFWTDIHSDKEIRSIDHALKDKGVKSRLREEMRGYLKDRNPLLANFGKLLKKTLKNFEEKQMVLEESYVSSERSLLYQLQNDLLSLYNPEQSAPRSFNDETVRLFSAKTKLHEVEILYKQLLDLFQDKQLSPKDVLVFAPNISLYAPYIQMVFKRHNSFQINISDLPLSSQSHYLRGVLSLFSLVDSRWEMESLLPLLFNRFFQRRFSLNDQDVSLFKKWLEIGTFQFGSDKEHKAEILEEKEISSVGTLEYTLDRLFFGALLTEQTHAPFYPLEVIHDSQFEDLGKWMHLFVLLKKDISFLKSDAFLPIDEACTFIDQMLDTYFFIDSEDEERRYYAFFKEEIKSLQQDFTEKRSVSIGSLIHSFKEKCSALKAELRDGSLEAISFRTLKLGRATPAKVIYLLGLNEEEFPSKEPLSPLQEWEIKIPTKAEEQRGAFLEMLCNARSHLLMSYPQLSEKDQEKLRPSLIVQELFSYLDVAFEAEGKKPSDLLIKPYKEESERSHFDHPPFISNFSLQKEVKEDITVKDLMRCAKHPLQFYFNSSLDVYLSRESDPNLQGASYEREIICKAALHEPLEKILEREEAYGRLPQGLFKDLFIQKVQQEYEELRSHFQKWGIDKKDLFSAKLQISSPHLSPLYVDGCAITGDINDMTPEGILVRGEGKLSDVLKAWPLLLLIQNHPSLKTLVKPALLFMKSGKKLVFSFKDEARALSDFLDYVFIARKHPSPFMPDYAESFLSGDEEELKKSIVESLHPWGKPPDPYLKWSFREIDKIPINQIFDTWAPFLRNVFSLLMSQKVFENSFPSRKRPFRSI